MKKILLLIFLTVLFSFSSCDKSEETNAAENDITSGITDISSESVNNTPDSDNRAVITYHSNGKIESVTKYEMYGFIAEQKLYDTDGILIKHGKYVDGKIAEEINYDLNGEIDFVVVYEYSGNGSPILKSTFDGNGVLQSEITLDDTFGLEIMIKDYLNGELNTTTEIDYYDDQTVKMKLISDKDGNIVERHTFEYYEKGIQSKKTSYYIDTGLTCEYLYHRNGSYEIVEYKDKKIVRYAICDTSGKITELDPDSFVES